MEYNFIIDSLDEARRVAFAVARILPPTGLVTFQGEMGAGKTTFIAMMLAAFAKIHKQQPPLVTSPTFSLIHEYMIGIIKIAHCDFFRLENASDIDALGFEEYLDNALCLVEWPDLIKSYNDEVLIACQFFYDNNQRCLTVAMNKRYSMEIKIEQ